MTDRSPDPWWHSFVAAAEALPAPAQAAAMLGIARTIARRGDKASAALIGYRASQIAARHADPATAREARSFLSHMIPNYHAQVATDPDRAAAWDAALSGAIRPGTQALEIGTGCGILAMMAARAGARVTACERDPALAAIAEETVRANGLGHAIRVVAKPAEALAIPQDLPAPADLLFLDVFADNLFGFGPFALLRATRHLLAPDARVIPARVALIGALAHSTRWERQMPGQVAGFDLSPLRAAGVGAVGLGPEGSVTLRSGPAPLVSATLPHDLPDDQGESVRDFASAGGMVNGLAVWLRLDLGAGQVLEAHPGTRPSGFYARPQFHAFETEFDTRPGDRLAASLAWRRRGVYVTRVE